ncbi:MAG TPA: YceI family protein [Flavobacteriales bacterium]|nr:YceI family protein [Flavobacteriales bacterium]
MRNLIISLMAVGIVVMTTAFTQVGEKFVSKNGHISFFSHTAVMDITANNYQVVSSIDVVTGKVVFSVSMQAFEFKKSLMQKHFNSDKYLDTKVYPKAKFIGQITNLDQIDFTTDGVYDATVEGTLNMHGVTNNVTEKGTITINGSKVIVEATMSVTLAKFEIAFEKGKPSKNIAKDIEITINAEHLLKS